MDKSGVTKRKNRCRLGIRNPTLVQKNIYKRDTNLRTLTSRVVNSRSIHGDFSLQHTSVGF